MRLRTALLLLLGIVVVAPLLAFLIVRWHMTMAPAPKPDLVNLGRYRSALTLSHDPVAAQIRRQIADGPAALARERASAQAAGIDLDPAHLQRPMPPADQNAAPLYDRWEARRRKEAMRLPLYANPLNNRYAYTPAQLARVQASLDAHPDVMALLHQAADRPLCVYAEDWQHIGTKGAPFGKYTGLREGVRELTTESYLLAKQSRYAEAVADQARGFRVAEHAASEPTLIGYLVGVACEAVTLAGMETILDLAGPDPTVAALVRQTVSARRPRMSLRHTLAGEAVISSQEVEHIRAVTPAGLASYVQNASATGYGPPPPGLDPAARFSPDEQRFLSRLADAAEANQLHRLCRMCAVADAAPAVRHRVEAQLARETVAAKSDPAQRLNPATTLSGLFVLGLSQWAEKSDQSAAQEQVLMAGAEALEVKGRTGAFPAHLPGRYPDPFHDGKPLFYRREGVNGFVVYSVGPTGKFTGGLPGQHRWTPYQVAFRYPGPALMAVPPDMLK